MPDVPYSLIVGSHKKDYLVWCLVSYTVYSISHLPGAFFEARLLDLQEGANTERDVVSKLSARYFQRRHFWHRHYSNYSDYSNYLYCGDIDHGKCAQEGVIVWYTPSYTVLQTFPR